MTPQERKRLIEEAERIALEAGYESAIDYAARFQGWHKPRNQTNYRIDADAVNNHQLTVLKALALQGTVVEEQNEEGYDEGIAPPLFYHATGKLQQRITQHKQGEHHKENAFQANIKKTEPTASPTLAFRHFKASDEFKRYLDAQQGNERAALIDYAAATENWREIDTNLYVAKPNGSKTALFETMRHEGLVSAHISGRDLFYSATDPVLITTIQNMSALQDKAQQILSRQNGGGKNEHNR